MTEDFSNSPNWSPNLVTLVVSQHFELSLSTRTLNVVLQFEVECCIDRVICYS